jgi:hypothetical protein
MNLKNFQINLFIKGKSKQSKKLEQVSRIIIKKLKYKNFRFYFIVNGYRLKILNLQEINEILIKF